MLDDSFPAMGTVARVVRDGDGGLDVPSVFAEIDHRLSRFDPGSDLSRLNADPSACVWPVKCGVVFPDVVEIDGAERRQRFL